MPGMIFRLLLKATIPLCIVFGVMFYLMYLNGQDPMSVLRKVGGNLLADFGRTTESIGQLPKTVGDGIEGESRTFYKWQDASGSWHYGESPPASAQSVQAIRLRLTENVVPAFQQPEPEVDEDEDPDKSAEEGEIPTDSPYSPEQIKQLFEDAKQLQETLDQRRISQEALIGITPE